MHEASIVVCFAGGQTASMPTGVGNASHLLEVANLGALSQAKVYEFLFVALPLKIVGGAGSPVRRIAIVRPNVRVGFRLGRTVGS